MTTLGFQFLITLCESLAEEGIAIGSEDDFVGLEIDSDDGHLGLGDWKTVNHSIGLVLVLHRLEHSGNHDLSGWIVGFQEFTFVNTFCQECSDSLSPKFGQTGFVRFGVVEILSVNQTLAVAHEPYLTSASTVNDGRCTKALLWTDGHATDGEAQPVVTTNHLRNADAELPTTDIRGHTTDVPADEQHGITAVAEPGNMATERLRSAPVDDGDEVICDDQAVFAFLGGALRDKALFEYLHKVV